MALVFDAFTKPEEIQRWLRPRGDGMTACEVGLCAGGTYCCVWHLGEDEHGRRGEAGMGGTLRAIGTFREIDPPE